jgi:hypothetical protein
MPILFTGAVGRPGRQGTGQLLEPGVAADRIVASGRSATRCIGLTHESGACARRLHFVGPGTVAADSVAGSGRGALCADAMDGAAA